MFTIFFRFLVITQFQKTRQVVGIIVVVGLLLEEFSEKFGSFFVFLIFEILHSQLLLLLGNAGEHASSEEDGKQCRK